MTKQVTVPLLRTTDYEAIELPYKNSSLALTIVVPRKGIPWEEFCKLVDNTQDLLRSRGFENKDVLIEMPRFTIESKTPFASLLKELMPSAFSERQADFRGISARPLYLQDLIHMAAIDVNEQGTEAAAATAAILRPKGGPMPNRFVVDRPFLFFLHDKVNAITFFAGQLFQPPVFDG